MYPFNTNSCKLETCQYIRKRINFGNIGLKSYTTNTSYYIKNNRREALPIWTGNKKNTKIDVNVNNFNFNFNNIIYLNDILNNVIAIINIRETLPANARAE